MTFLLVNAVPMKYTAATLNAKGGTDVAVEELVLGLRKIDLGGPVTMARPGVCTGRVTFQRLPGVTFLPRPPARRPLLPRLDVAAFTGFAERGPLNTPVPVEDANVYAAVFGGELELARRRRSSDRRSGDDGEKVTAHLPLTVEQFFANRGRRCYVVRVAGGRRRRRGCGWRASWRSAAASARSLAAVSASSPGSVGR